jgi:serine/threonine protein kinase
MPNDSLIDELLLRWEEQRRRGETPSATQLCAECPELLPEVEERLLALLRWEEFLDVGRPPPVERPPGGGGVTIEATTADRPPSNADTTASDGQIAERIGPYRPQRLLGAGSFGEVWLAIREGEIANTRLAIKLPRALAIDREEIRREAGLWALASNHPNVVPVFEANVYDGRVVIASEYCEDGSLADYLKGRGARALPRGEALDLVLGMLAGLAHLHGLGIVHRDIKPANVLLHKGVPRLADFGLSRLLARETSGGAPAGTPAFMAPEAFDGVRSEATDVWSVGVVSYLLLAGTLPFPERDWTSLFKAVVTRDPPPLPDHVPASVRGIVRMALEKDPSRRLSSAVGMSEMIRKSVGGLGTADHPVRVAAHLAVFVGSSRPALFINVTNLSPTLEREVTHVWLEADRQVHVTNARRPLPKRLRPQESWETWIEFWQLPPAWAAAPSFERVRVRLSTGEEISGVRNTSVPERGFIPGEPVAAAEAADLSPNRAASPVLQRGNADPAARARPWWKFW